MSNAAPFEDSIPTRVHPLIRDVSEDVAALPRSDGASAVQKTLAILKITAERGGATAQEISETLAMPIPSVYRLLQELVQAGYLVHLRGEKRFALGYKLHGLGGLPIPPADGAEFRTRCHR